ncbi:MAG: FKBP-type peptidyl-prolyl cis-trans isomerase [Halomonas sp.]|nr:FKBP-type peptidyl-prolyl cis-trans isomerase [Halomonas sp.]
MNSIHPHCEVIAAYTLADANGNTLATSTKETPLRYIHGAGQMIAALETALSGHQAGDELNVTLTPEQAYGQHRSELVFEAVRENLPAGKELHVGMTLTPGGQQGKFSLKVVELTERGAILDGNHPLAGKTVTWQIKILAVNSPKTDRQVESQPIKWVNV